MTTETGFFNSENGDKIYNAEDLTGFYGDFFTNGIVADNTSYLQVTKNNGLKLWVLKGKAYINGGFFKPKTSKEITLPDSDTTFPRYDIVVLRWDKIARDIYLDVISGNSNENPQYPTLTRNETTYELGLAAVYVAANATEITQDKITDLRFNDDYCGVVTGVIKTISTKKLFAQYEAEWDLMRAAWAQDEEAVIAAWAALNATKSVNGIAPVNGNVSVTLDDVPDGEERRIPGMTMLLEVDAVSAAAYTLADSVNNYNYIVCSAINTSKSVQGMLLIQSKDIAFGERYTIEGGTFGTFDSDTRLTLSNNWHYEVIGVKV